MKIKITPFFKFQKILVLLAFFSLYSCLSSQQKVKVDENFYKDCMDTIQDKEKCDSLVRKAEEREKENEVAQVKLTEEQMAGLEIRDEFKTRMFGKTRLAVTTAIGEPEEKVKDGNEQEFFIYRKPLTRFSPQHDPDKEIIIVFRRQFVTRVMHTPPDSTPRSFIPFGGDRPKENKIRH